MDYPQIKSRVRAMGITFLDGVDLADYESLSDGCSGGLSWLYALGGREISCHRCCVAHDFLYGWGGTDTDRKKADTLLRWCAAGSGSGGKIRRVWCAFRSWVMYVAVRLFGGGDNHWAGG